MELKDIIDLAHAGFTAQQIAVLAQQPAQQPAQQTAQQPAQQTAQQTAQQPAQQTAQQPAQQPAQLDPIMQQLQQISGMIQHNNINSFHQPQPESVDSILASIINPPTIAKE